MTNDQTAAIMGAHTLGNMEEEHSGYSGTWVTDPEGVLTLKNSFDNAYYSFMINPSFEFFGRVSFSKWLKKVFSHH